MTATVCPSRETLLQYSLGLLSDEQRNALDNHLESCPDCQAMMMTLDDADDTVIGRLRTPASNESFVAEPQLQDALAATMAMPAGGASDMPETLGEYRLLEELGCGGMGRVYKALHTKLDRVVAVKVLPHGRVGDQRVVDRFEREMKAVGQLVHPNIVQAYDAREIDGTPVLIMEFIDGLDLAEIVRRVGPLPPADACELVRQTALALQCAHEHGLVHRDIKPSNIMLARSGEVKLLDLGLARFYAESGPGVGVAVEPSHQRAEEMTGTGQAMGTADYMAPEQASDSRTVDIRADLYSLGCTLYKLLSGRAPFSSPEYRTTLDKLNAHVHQPAPFIRRLVPDVPEKLAAIIDRLLAKDPDDRFATPTEVAEALAPWCEDADLSALLQRAIEATSSPLPSGEGRGEGNAAQQPATKPPLLLTSWGWKWFTGQLILLLLAGGFGFALGIMIRIHKDGKTTTVTVPEGSNVAVDAHSEMDVTLPGHKKHATRTALPQTKGDRSQLEFEIARVAADLAAQKALLKSLNASSTLTTELDAAAANDPIARQLSQELRLRKLDQYIQGGTPGSEKSKYADRYQKDLQQLQKQYDQRLDELQKNIRKKERSHIEKEIVQLEARLASLREDQKPVQASPLQFGPVIEHVVNAVSEGKGGEGLDLASGKLVDAPKEFGKWSAQQQSKWCTDNHVDLAVDFWPDSSLSLLGSVPQCDLVPEGLKLAAIQNERWDSVTDAELRSAITSVTPGLFNFAPGSRVQVAEVRERRGITYFKIETALPASFVFQTRHGDLGILQVIRFTDEPKGVRIRYKLAQLPPTPAAVSTR